MLARGTTTIRARCDAADRARSLQRHEPVPSSHTCRILLVLLRVCPGSLRGIANFSPKFGEGGGLENRRLVHKKLRLGQVLACRILTACGDVAEWPKAAVC